MIMVYNDKRTDLLTKTLTCLACQGLSKKGYIMTKETKDLLDRISFGIRAMTPAEKKKMDDEIDRIIAMGQTDKPEYRGRRTFEELDSSSLGLGL